MQMESLLRELAEDLGNLKGQERSPCTRKDERKEEGKERRESEMSSVLLGDLKEKRFESWKGPSPADRSAGTGRRFRGLEKRALSRLRQAGQSDSYMEGLSHSPCTHARDTR